MSATRGDGRLYQRGRIWWIQYCHRGHVFRESARSEDERVARRLLRKRLGELTVGVFLGPKAERTTFEDLAKEIENDYRINGRKSADKLPLRLAYLRTAFGLDRIIDVTTDRIKAYIVRRQEEGAANATINRELATLKRMFSLGVQCGKVATKPYVPMLREHNVRTGFFEHEDFIRLRDVLPEDLRPLVTFGYYTGWRIEEIRSLRWYHVDLTAGCVRLDPGTTKNDQGRIVYLTAEMRETLTTLWQARRLDCPWVFHRGGKPVGDFRKAWADACAEAKTPGRLFHDFRRTAVRNMVRAGVPERVAMQISGHKTRAIFDRYHIVSDTDLKEAAQRVETYAETQTREPGKVVVLLAPVTTPTTNRLAQS